MNINHSDDVYSLEELAEKYPRQWLSVAVVERDNQNGQPVRVKLLARELDVHSVRARTKSTDYCTFYTGPIPEVNYIGMF
jgi:hypothetical protein